VRAVTTADHLDARPAPAGRRAGTRARFEQRRSEVVDVSARLFAERGYANTSIDDLVDATGLQRGGLYHYIDSKQQLLLLIHEELLAPLLLQAEEIVASELDPETRLRGLLRVWVAHVASHRDHMVVFYEERRLIESDAAWHDVRLARERFRDLLEGVLRDGQRERRFAIADLDVAEMAILGVVNHMPHWLDPAGRLAPVEVADRCADLLLDGLLPRTSSD
jgi:AcrR family transcriptional regulator